MYPATAAGDLPAGIPPIEVDGISNLFKEGEQRDSNNN